MKEAVEVFAIHVIFRNLQVLGAFSNPIRKNFLQEYEPSCIRKNVMFLVVMPLRVLFSMGVLNSVPI